MSSARHRRVTVADTCSTRDRIVDKHRIQKPAIWVWRERGGGGGGEKTHVRCPLPVAHACNLGVRRLASPTSGFLVVSSPTCVDQELVLHPCDPVASRGQIIIRSREEGGVQVVCTVHALAGRQKEWRHERACRGPGRHHAGGVGGLRRRGGGAGRGEPAQAMVLVLHVWHCCTQPCLYSFSSLYVHVSASRHFGRPGESCK